MEVGLPRQRHRKRRGSGFAVALQAEAAQRRVKFSQVVRMKIDGERRRARGGVRAQHAMRFKIALRQVEFEFAQVHRAVVLRIGSVDRARGGHFAGGSLPGGTETELRIDRDRVAIAVRPDGNRGAIQARVEAQTPVGRGADHVEYRIERDIFEFGGHFAVDGDDRGWGADESIPIG